MVENKKDRTLKIYSIKEAATDDQLQKDFLKISLSNLVLTDKSLIGHSQIWLKDILNTRLL